MTNTFTFIKYELIDRVGFITLNRPEKRNALNADLVSELSKAFSLCEDDPQVKVIVLKGEGKIFCAGADLDYLQKLSEYSFEENLKDSQNLKGLLFQIYSLKKIVIAQVNGHAIAGGAGLATVCDFVFAVPEANFGYTEVKLGFIPAIVSVFVIRKIGEGKTRELLLSGNLISAQKALEFGLISSVVSENLDKVVATFAQELVQNTSSKSVELTKKLLLKVQDLPLSEALDFACSVNAKMRETEDFKKGVGAFLKKETPKWN